jgi:hypothetical protein
MRCATILILLAACGGNSDVNTGPNAEPERILTGPFTGDRVSGATDVTGDGAPDVVISSPGLDGSGSVFILDASLKGSLGPGDATATIQASEVGDIGEGLAVCGDLNGDGNDDMAIGLPWGNAGRGGVWLLNGPFSGNLTTDDAYLVRGNTYGAATGFTVTCGSDFDLDGLHDVVFSAPDADGFGIAERTGQVYFHKALEEGTNAVANFSTTFSDSYLGRNRSLSIDHDFNGDGLPDAVMGAHGASRVYVLFADSDVETSFGGTIDGNETGALFTGREDEDGAGHDVDAGDVNGDGYVDLVIGAPFWDRRNGAIGIVNGPFEEGTYGQVAILGRWIDGQDPLEEAGFSIAVADLNGDGLADIVAGAPGSVTVGDDSGVVYGLLGPAEMSTVLTADHVILGTLPYARFGSVVAAVPDATGDGLDEILVGAPHTDINGTLGAGAALLFHSPLGDRIEDVEATATYIF